MLDTFIYRSDGGIVAYEGEPGLLKRMFVWPRIIQRPTRSWAEMWWPVVMSVAITLWVHDLLRREVSQRAPELVSLINADV